MKISSLAKRTKALQVRASSDPMSYFRPTPPQRDYIADESPIKMLLGGNQVGAFPPSFIGGGESLYTGKTAASCYLLLAHCLNRHPYINTDPPPI